MECFENKRQNRSRYIQKASPLFLFVDHSSVKNRSPEDLIPVHNGMRSVAAYLRHMGHHANVIFSVPPEYGSKKAGMSFLVEEIIRLRPKAIGFSPYQSFGNGPIDILEIEKIVGRIKDNDTHPFVVLGGHFASINSVSLFRDFSWIDFIVKGEGERSVQELYSSILNGNNAGYIPGICYRRGRKIIENKLRPAIDDLNDLPISTLDHLDYAVENELPIISHPICSSRGCHGNCSFCSIHTFYQLSPTKQCWRARSPKSVVDEIELVNKKYSVNYFRFMDDNIIGFRSGGMNRARELANEIIKRKLKIKFRISCRPDGVELGILSSLKKAGLDSVAVGFESGSDEALRTYSKKQVAGTYRDTLLSISRLHLAIIPLVIFINPYSTIEEVKSNIAFISFANKLSNVCWANDFILTSMKVFSGTVIQNRLKKDGLLEGNYLSGFFYRFMDPKVYYIHKVCKMFEAFNSNYTSLIHQYMVDHKLFNGQKMHIIGKFIFLKKIACCDFGIMAVIKCIDILEKGKSGEFKPTVEKIRHKLNFLYHETARAIKTGDIEIISGLSKVFAGGADV